MNQLPKGVEPAWWGGKNGGNGYGFTMSVTTDVAATTGYGSVGDFGWDGAASTFFRVDPKEHLVVLVMTQRMPRDLEIQVKAKALAYQALTGPVATLSAGRTPEVSVSSKATLRRVPCSGPPPP